MLSLLLALALTPDPEVDAILKTCDTPKMMKTCAFYIQGFVHSIQAQNEIATMVRPEVNVSIPSFACFPKEYDINAVRLGIVSDLKERRTIASSRVQVLVTISRLFPCSSRDDGKR